MNWWTQRMEPWLVGAGERWSRLITDWLREARRALAAEGGAA